MEASGRNRALENRAGAISHIKFAICSNRQLPAPPLQGEE